MTPVFHPAAAEELAAAAEAYESRAPRLGQELVIEARRLVALLCANPLIGEPLDKGAPTNANAAIPAAAHLSS